MNNENIKAAIFINNKTWIDGDNLSMGIIFNAITETDGDIMTDAYIEFIKSEGAEEGMYKLEVVKNNVKTITEKYVTLEKRGK